MSNMQNLFKESIEVKLKILKSDEIQSLEIIGERLVKAVLKGNKIMLCGNGGSAADAQHLAAEMLIRLRPKNNRKGIPALALAQDTSTITACGNDFGYKVLYERLIKTLGREGDCLIGITTSGNSENILLAMKAAKEMGIEVFGFLGSGGGQALKLSDEVFLVPSNCTGRIQESHITAGHALMEYVEDRLIELDFIQLEN